MNQQSRERMTYENYILKSSHVRMDARRRAKIFQPFNALEGLCEELVKEERISSPRPHLCESAKELLDETLSTLHAGQMVRVTWFDASTDEENCFGEYRTIEGKLTRIDKIHRMLQIIQTVIPFRDICRIEREGSDISDIYGETDT